MPPGYDAVLGEYAAALERAPLSAETRRTYRSRVRMYLAWLADHAATYSADPLTDRQACDWAVRDYRMWLLRDGPARRSRVYVNSTLNALDDFCTRADPLDACCRRTCLHRCVRTDGQRWCCVGRGEHRRRHRWAAADLG